jgi:hypothetical protein
VWKRKGDSAGWPCGRGPLYPTGRPTVLACCVPKPKPFSPLSLPGRGGRPCKCAFSDTERTAFSTAVVSASAVGGHDAAHAHAHARRHAASSQQTASARSRPPTAMHLLAAHQRPSHRAAQHGAGTACGDTAALHAARPGSALSVQCACQRAQSPFQRSLRAGRGRADDLLAPSQAGVVDCMALQRAAGLIRHGRCRARACDLREPLIIHARRPRRPACSALVSLLSPVPQGCMRTALARGRPLDAALSRMWPPSARGCKERCGTVLGQLVVCTIRWRAVFASRPFVCTRRDAHPRPPAHARRVCARAAPVSLNTASARRDDSRSTLPP